MSPTHRLADNGQTMCGIDLAAVGSAEGFTTAANAVTCGKCKFHAQLIAGTIITDQDTDNPITLVEPTDADVDREEAIEELLALREELAPEDDGHFRMKSFECPECSSVLFIDRMKHEVDPLGNRTYRVDRLLVEDGMGPGSLRPSKDELYRLDLERLREKNKMLQERVDYLETKRPIKKFFRSRPGASRP